METTMKQFLFSTVLSVMAMALTPTVSHAVVDNFKRDFIYKVCARNNGDTFTVNVDMKNTGDRAEFGAVLYKNDGSVLRTFNNFFGSKAGPEWMRGSGEQKVGTKNNKCFSFSMQGKDDGAGWIALKGTAPTTDTSNPDGLVVKSQLAIKQRTMQMRLTVTTPDGSTYQPKITGDFSSGGSASPPQAQNNGSGCNDYADKAIALKYAADSLGCGFSDGRWDSSFEQHRDWCLANQNNGAPARETNFRAEAFNACRDKKTDAAAQKPSKTNNDVAVFLYSTDGGFRDNFSVVQEGEYSIRDFVNHTWEDNADDRLNDDVEVVSVLEGTEVTLYEHHNFGGASVSLACGTYELIGEPENEVSSMVLRPVPVSTVCSGSPANPTPIRSWD
jgi:hypothetical protein